MSTLASFRLDGRVSVVTGGARGLGYDIADVLAEAGSDLVITSRHQEAVDEAADKFREAHGVQVLPLTLDHCDFDQVVAVAQQALDWQERIDVLVNNAGGGVGDIPDLFERPPEAIKAMIETNLIGPMYCCREFGRAMVEAGRGSIINIASIAGMCGRDRRMYERTGLGQQPIGYAAAKGGVISMTMDLAGYLTPKGVRVNAVSPGGFERGQVQAFIDAYSDATPMGRMGRDGVDLKGAIIFLASDASAYVTGQNLAVDGGFVMWK